MENKKATEVSEEELRAEAARYISKIMTVSGKGYVAAEDLITAMVDFSKYIAGRRQSAVQDKP